MHLISISIPVSPVLFFYMKSFAKPLVLLLCGCLTATFSQAQCDSSSLTLLAFTPAGGGTFDLTVEYCIGGGILGVNSGAGSQTTTYAFGMYGTGLTLNSYPASQTSDSTGCTNTATTFTGSLGADVGVAYITGGCNYTCVTSTAACGMPHSDCNTVVFNVNQMPDSMRLFGAEGNGNPFAGCYPNSSMSLNFLVLLAADFLSFDASVNQQSVSLSWETDLPDQDLTFEIQRYSENTGWTSLDRIPGNQDQTMYTWTNQSPSGSFLYRIQSTGVNGEVTFSPSVEVVVTEPWAIRLSPNPADHTVLIEGEIAPGDQYELTDLQGRIMMSGQIDSHGSQELSIPNSLSSGTYLLKMISSTNSTVNRLQIR